VGTGGVGLQGHRVELGYVIARGALGPGLRNQAATRIIGWAMENSTIVRVWAYCHVDNAASARVLAKTGHGVRGTSGRVGRLSESRWRGRRLLVLRSRASMNERFGDGGPPWKCVF
jgi:RimJ/RimL family protein N-acetyltransferase